MHLFMNLKNEITVFVISCGNNPNYENCLQALKNQNVEFTLDIIKDYKPMSHAFQQMIDRCTTPFFIQVDEDMILNAGAVKAMYCAIKTTPQKVAMIGFMLRDVHMEIDIYGVKIYRYSALFRYPYNLQHPSCEVDQLDRMKKDGYSYNLNGSVMGLHSPLWSNEDIYERYFNLMQKFRIYGYVWMEHIPARLFSKLRLDCTETNLYAMLGAFAGITSDSIITGEKNFTMKPEKMRLMSTYLQGPKHATMYITGNCNFKCKFCHRQSESGIEKHGDMSLETATYVLDKLPSIKAVCVCGYGEPLMCNTLPSILAMLKARSIFIGLITNGSLLTKQYPMLLRNPPNYLSVSLNGHTAPIHRDITGSEAFQTVLEGIKMVAKDGKIPLYVTTVVTKKNYRDIPAFLEFVRGLGVDQVYLHNVLPHYDYKDFWEDVLTTDDIEIYDYIAKSPDIGIVRKLPQPIDRSAGNFDCKQLWNNISVNSNGSLGLCNGISCDKKFGNIRDNIVWNSNILTQYRQDYIHGKLEDCKMCFWHWKGG